jgi:hypothetical protein
MTEATKSSRPQYTIEWFEYPEGSKYAGKKSTGTGLSRDVVFAPRAVNGESLGDSFLGDPIFENQKELTSWMEANYPEYQFTQTKYDTK